MGVGARNSRAVLVTDGEQRAALAVVRSLAASGWRCVVGSAGGRSLASVSRYADAAVTLPDPGSDSGGFAKRVAEVVEQEAIDVIIPIAEPSLLAVLACRDTIAAAIPFPDLRTFEAICDKQRLLRTAAEVGIRVPRQIDLQEPSAGDNVRLRPPFVLKPHRSVCTAADGSRVKVGVSWAHTRDDLPAALTAYPPSAYPILLQECVMGPGVGVFVLLSDNETTASFAHRRIREKPPSGGVSVVRQSEPMDPALLEKSVALLRRHGWIGVAMVEYKLDDATGEPVLMEVNGRFWGSLQLAIDAGVDFPGLLLEPTPSALRRAEQYAFVRSRWFWGDVDHVIAVWRDPRGNLRERLRAVWGCIRAFGPGYREEVFRWSDPRPFMLETALWFKQVLRPD